MKTFKTTGLTGLLVALCLLATGSTHATLINFDAGAINGSSNPGATPSPVYSGAAEIGSGSDFWNSANLIAQNPSQTAGISYPGPVVVPNLLAADSTATGVGLTVTADTGIGANYFTNGGADGNALTGDFWNTFNQSGTLSLAITGLANGASYNLYFYSYVSAINNGSTFTVSGNPTSQTASGIGDGTTYVQNVDYVQFSGTVSGGQIDTTVTWSGTGVDTYKIGVFDGFQLQLTPAPTPEPSSLVLGGVGALVAGLVRVIRRRNRKIAGI